MAKELLVHVGLSQEGHHEDLLLRQAQPGAAVDVPIQVPPAHFPARSFLICVVPFMGSPVTVVLRVPSDMVSLD